MLAAMRIAALVVSLLTVSAAARADVHIAKAGKVSIDVPKTYKLTTKDDLVSGASADNAVAIFVWIVDQPDAKQAIDLLEPQIKGMVKGQKWDGPTTAKVHGLDGFYFGGTGHSVSTTVALFVEVMGPTPTKKGVIVFAAIDATKLKDHEAEIKAIFGSLAPVK
jgi:hypothetical protein